MSVQTPNWRLHPANEAEASNVAQPRLTKVKQHPDLSTHTPSAAALVRNDVFKAILALVDRRLFAPVWLPDEVTRIALDSELVRLGLYRNGKKGDIEYTALGK